MDAIKPGDRVRLNNAEKNRSLSTGFVFLRYPNEIEADVPRVISQQGLRLINHLLEWGIISKVEIEKAPPQMVEEVDTLDNKLVDEYNGLNAKEAIIFLNSVSPSIRTRFIEHERRNKCRKTVLKAFS